MTVTQCAVAFAAAVNLAAVISQSLPSEAESSDETACLQTLAPKCRTCKSLVSHIDDTWCQANCNACGGQLSPACDPASGIHQTCSCATTTSDLEACQDTTIKFVEALREMSLDALKPLYADEAACTISPGPFTLDGDPPFWGIDYRAGKDCCLSSYATAFNGFPDGGPDADKPAVCSPCDLHCPRINGTAIFSKQAQTDFTNVSHVTKCPEGQPCFAYVTYARMGYSPSLPGHPWYYGHIDFPFMSSYLTFKFQDGQCKIMSDNQDYVACEGPGNIMAGYPKNCAEIRTLPPTTTTTTTPELGGHCIGNGGGCNFVVLCCSGLACDGPGLWPSVLGGNCCLPGIDPGCRR